MKKTRSRKSRDTVPLIKNVYVIIHFSFSSFLYSPSYLGSCWQQPRGQPVQPEAISVPARDKTGLSSASTKAIILTQGPTGGPSDSSETVGHSASLGDKFDHIR